MQRNGRERLDALRRLWLAWLVFGGLTAIPSARAEQPGTVVHVAAACNGQPFDYRVESVEEKATFTVLRLSYPSPVLTPVPQNNTVPAEYYLPKGIRPGDPKRPAVICVHILDGNMELVRMTCSVLASRGIPSILFLLPYYGPRAPAEGPEAMAVHPELFLGAIRQAMEDVRRTVDVLASRPEVDAAHIGITGISLGGIVAATASGLEPRLSRAMLVLAGGDLETIIGHARETAVLSATIRGLPADKQQEIAGILSAVDPLTQAGRLRRRAQDGRVLMVNAAEDEVIPRACTEKLAEALGIGDRVVWLDGLGHYTALAELPRILDRMAAFFAQDMPPGAVLPTPPAAAKRTAPQIVASLLQQLATILVGEPGEGRCQYVDLEVKVQPSPSAPLPLAGEGRLETPAKTGKAIEARLRLIRGSKKRFKLECETPAIGRVAIGQGEYPWMVSGGKRLIKGTNNPAAGSRDPWVFVERQNIVKLQVAAGAAAGAAIAPDVLDQVVAVTEVPPVDGRRAIRVRLKDAGPGSLQLILRDDGRTPERIVLDISGVVGVVTIRSLETDTASLDGMFRPPRGLEEKEVEQADLLRMFAALLNFAMEAME